MIGFVRAILLAILVRIIVGTVAALASYTALSSALPHRAAPPSLRDTIAAVRAGLSEIDRVWPGLAHPRAPVSASRGPFRLRGVRLERPWRQRLLDMARGRKFKLRHYPKPSVLDDAE